MGNREFDPKSVVNVASVKHRSPFRYPGGKTWLVPRVRQWLSSIKKPSELVEPFAGGGIVGLSALFEGYTDRLTLVEIDPDVAAVWKVITNGKGRALAERIASFAVTEESVREFLSVNHRSVFDRAFATILRNRMQRGGIMAKGASLMKQGENGKGLLSRWYPQTLKQRIEEIVSLKSAINFIEGDGLEVIRATARRRDVAYFVDPPYTVAGRRLYNSSEVDDAKLFKAMSKVQGDFLMTYDNVEPIRQLAREFAFDMHEVAMKNTHHAVMSELLIGRNLDWARG